MFNRWNELLYDYYKEAGGSFTGEVGASFPECRLTLDYHGKMIHLEPVIKKMGNSTFQMCGRAILSATLDTPLIMTLQPYGFVNKAVDLVVKKDIITGNPALDKIYLIRGSNTESIKMSLNGSRLADLLVSRRDTVISVKPVMEDETLHTIQAVTKDYLYNAFSGEPLEISPGHFAELTALCYETWRAVTDY